MANIIEHTPSLPDLFKTESKSVRKALGLNCKGIHHIGSTSVKTVAPSKTVDMLAVVKDLEKIADHEKKLKDHGYVSADKNIPENGYLYIKNGNNISFRLYIYNINDLDNTERLIAVRDYLRAHNDAASEYSEFKTKTLKDDPDGYEESKAEYLKGLEEKAVRWQRAQNRKVVCISLGMCIGSGLGCCFGAANGNMALGVSIGISIGVALGIACGFTIEKKG